MNKEQFFSICPDRPVVEPVDTPAGRAYVRVISVAERDAMEDAVQEAKKKNGGVTPIRTQVLIACCCREDGTPVFDEFEAARVGDLPAYVVEPVFEAALRLNRMGVQDAEAARKNSENGRSSSSDTSSVSSSAG